MDRAKNNTVLLYEVNGQILATKQDEYSPLHFDVPTSGTYLVRIGLPECQRTDRSGANHPACKVVVIR